ncbi:MAG: ABC transporter ATP-binding protein [Magnetococcales bacterium]|nr:ABC transporter ATP-binding protein [Magnetococcales bacterium]
MDLPPLLELRNISKSYQEADRKVAILDNLQATFAAGKMAAIIGRSGSGKTTLLNLISGIDEPCSGEVRVKGVSLTGQTEEKRTLFRRRHIGFIFQFFNLIPTLTVEENILFPLELNQMLSPPNRAWASQLIQQVGLAGREESFPDRLSGGEQQRVAIARALVHRPQLILADEPTGNLDQETGREILNLMIGLTTQLCATLIMVTHSLEFAERADHLFTLRQGQLVQAVRQEAL